MHIANLTPDTIEWMHIGVAGTLKPGDIKEFDDQRANFILTKFGRRGVVRLGWDDDLDEKRQQAMAAWEKFWRYQITVFNQDNERRKSTQREYVYPTKELQEHAEELGLKLIGPWTIENSGGADIAALANALSKANEQNAVIQQLAQQVAALQKQLGQTEAAAAIQEAEIKERETKDLQKELQLSKKETKEAMKRLKEEEVKDLEPFINEFMDLGKKELSDYVMNNSEMLQSNVYPRAAYELLKTRWENLFGKKEAFPLLLS